MNEGETMLRSLSLAAPRRAPGAVARGPGSAQMTIRAVAFDIGGVLEVTPPMDVSGKWERRLGLAHGSMAESLREVAEAGAVGAISEEQACHRIGEILGLDRSQVDALMADIWTE